MRRHEGPERPGGGAARSGKLWALAVIALVAVTGCSGDDGDGGGDPAAAEAPGATAAPDDLVAAIETDGGGEACDPMDPRACLLPFPSNRFTAESADTDTGLLVDLPEEGMPVNADGVVSDPTEWNRNDGFSPGTPLLAHVAGLDFEGSGLSDITDVPASLEDDSPVVVVDTETGERHPVWAELDASAGAEDEDQLLFLRPGTNYLEGHRYVVGLRNLVGADGEVLEPSPAFEAFRDNLTTELPVIEDRREAMEQVFADLGDAGVARDDLYLAWDFTIASGRNLSERLLHIRDDAFADLGAAAPEFAVSSVDRDSEPDVSYVHGTFDVPLYLTEDGAAGTRLTQGPDGLPERNGDYTAQFMCTVPESASDTPAHISLYGHGLLGSRDEVDAGNVVDFAREHNVVFCATDWIGMAEDDVSNAVSILGQLGEFPTLADRSQQGILNTLFLGRLMIHDDGLASDPAFQTVGGDPILDTSQLVFDANSQGGIMGGAATAVAQDWTRAVLGVPGMNYSLLLRRSVDFDTYAAILDPAYPDPVEQTLGISLIQMLWDRAENDGYAQHLTTDAYADTPEHQVLLNVAFGDHQVSMWSAEIMARTIGASVQESALAAGRHPDAEPYWGLPILEYPFDGSALMVWDSGAAVPPTTNSPPREGADPHEDPRADAANREQKFAFLFEGELIDVCHGPCTAETVE